MTENVFVTAGDSAYFPYISVSALMVRKLYPGGRFIVGDWGLTEKEKAFLQSLGTVEIFPWKTHMVSDPFGNSFKQFLKLMMSHMDLQNKYRCGKMLLREMIYMSIQREAKLAQKPHMLQAISTNIGTGRITFLDGDAILVAPIDEFLNSNDKLSVTIRRNHELDFTFGNCQVLNTGVVSINGSVKERSQIINMWIKTMMYRFEYLVEQSALTRMVLGFHHPELNFDQIIKTNRCLNMPSVSVKIFSCDEYNYNWIEEGIDTERNKILHFKGGRRNLNFFREEITKLFPSIDFDQIQDVWSRD